jgi:rhamnose utilization protein RhaD (predicted bifunctional aldolase and dehydrogenase)/NAD(P)-dependent dehydrogenase (short-subunit alcohol dehydrogenase family)
MSVGEPLENRWSEKEAAKFVAEYGAKWGEDLALRTYSGRLIGREQEMVLHGGGNASLKGTYRNVWGEPVPAIYVKGSGCDLATIAPEEYAPLDLEYLRRMRTLKSLSDDLMANEFRTHVLDCHAPSPSIETLAHAFLPAKYIDHTHADAILALTNQTHGEERVREALGEKIIILPYVRPGFDLAKEATQALERSPDSTGMVWMHHGLVTWGETARESYERTVQLIQAAEQYLARKATHPLVVEAPTPVETALARLEKVAPIVRGLLAEPTGDENRPYSRVTLSSLVNREVLDFVDSVHGKNLALSPPLTSDFLIRTKSLPLWVDAPDFNDLEKLRGQIAEAVEDYVAAYNAYFERHSAGMAPVVERCDPYPRVILIPGLGALCAGKNELASRIARDITAHTLAVKAKVAAMGEYQGLSESHLFSMEYHTLQQAKLAECRELPLSRQVAVVTGAAGAIGSAIAQELLAAGCQVAVTDLPGEKLDNLLKDLKAAFPEQVIGVPMDVTDPNSIAQAFGSIIRTWGGIDLVIVNAALAHVSRLTELSMESFRKLERVNVEGALLVLSETGRHFKLQGTGGDVVMVSTKNVFSPGAGFGAYSATKAAAHQLARIASLEFASIGARVNMIAPDAVFSHGSRKSGLWAEVGPDRMRSKGIEGQGLESLEEYYRNRNLLKTHITAAHVGKAVVFFATRQTPTTGATLPVDGGLPDATPR